MCWGAGILLSSGVVRAAVTIPGDLAWRLPFALQWVWPVPLLIGTYFAPESPWNAVRRNKSDLARKSLHRLTPNSEDKAQKVEAQLSYIRYTTELERAETEGAGFIDCFKGTNLRRTEINCMVWAIQILCGNALLNFSVVFLESAGFSTLASLDINIALSGCYIIGGVICWFLFPHFGRATIYMSGNLGMMILLVIIGGLAFSSHTSAKVAIAILFVITTLVNMISTGPGYAYRMSLRLYQAGLILCAAVAIPSSPRLLRDDCDTRRSRLDVLCII
jgi:MFS transporter, SP family, general alpha glucoside:H+ symporter